MNDLKPFHEKLFKLEDPWLIDDITFDQKRNQDRHLSRLQEMRDLHLPPCVAPTAASLTI